MHWTEHKRCTECGQIHCYWCGVAVQPYQRGPRNQPTLLSATREHLKPRAHGGRGASNIVVACYGCNNERGASPPGKWVPFHERGTRKMPSAQYLAFQRLGYLDRPLDATAV